MRQIRPFFEIALCALVSLLCMLGCKKDDECIMRVSVVEYADFGKIGMVGYVPFWHEGDCVMVNGERAIVHSNNGNATMVVNRADKYWGVFPADYVETAQSDDILLLIPKVQVYEYGVGRVQKVLAPLGGCANNSKSIQLSPMGALLKVEVANHTDHNGLMIDKLTLRSSSEAMWGRARVNAMSTDERNYQIVDPYQRGVNDSVVLSSEKEQSMSVRLNTSDVIDYYFYIPEITSEENRFCLRVYAHDAKNSYVYETSCLANSIGLIRRGCQRSEAIGLCDSIEHVVMPGALNGEFSINGRGERVVFSQGNLQYQNQVSITHATALGQASGTWRFADRQYDYIGEDNALIDARYTGWIDLFGWGTSGYHDPDDEYNSNYYPYSSSNFYNFDNIYNYYGYGPSTDRPDPNLTGSSANYDWGVFNAIDNGGNQPGMWRTLTYNEWYYLLYTRPGATEKMGTGRIQMAKGSRVNGLILLPDNWVLPAGCTFYPRTSDAPGDYSANTFTLAEWASMQANGAVFLPAAGYRMDWDVYNVGMYGRYWSATYDNAGSSYILSFYGHQVRMIDFDRSRGRSVRLVHDVGRK